jgi:hypothetical protein
MGLDMVRMGSQRDLTRACFVENANGIAWQILLFEQKWRSPGIDPRRDIRQTCRRERRYLPVAVRKRPVNGDRHLATSMMDDFLAGSGFC